MSDLNDKIRKDSKLMPAEQSCQFANNLCLFCGGVRPTTKKCPKSSSSTAKAKGQAMKNKPDTKSNSAQVEDTKSKEQPFGLCMNHGLCWSRPCTIGGLPQHICSFPIQHFIYFCYHFSCTQFCCLQSIGGLQFTPLLCWSPIYLYAPINYILRLSNPTPTFWWYQQSHYYPSHQNSVTDFPWACHSIYILCNSTQSLVLCSVGIQLAHCYEMSKK